MCAEGHAYQCSDSDACNVIYANVYAVAGLVGDTALFAR